MDVDGWQVVLVTDRGGTRSDRAGIVGDGDGRGYAGTTAGVVVAVVVVACLDGRALQGAPL